jgi:hypothetical protein
MNNIKTYLILLILMINTGICADGQGGTGFTINNSRNFLLSNTTIIKEDGLIIPQIRGQGGTGFKIRYRIGSDVNPDITGGTLEEINLINTHKGPVTSLDPFKIFNVDVLITGDTFFEGGLTLQDITIGQELKISSFVDNNSSLLATRIEADNQPLTEWKLSGLVSTLNATQFNVGPQTVILGGVTPDDCFDGFTDGVYVEIKAFPDPTFTAGSTLQMVTDIDCAPQDVINPPTGTIPVAVEGFIDFVDIDQNFTISGQNILVDINTVYINGEADDIAIGTKVEVEGLLDTNSSIISALKVKFLEVRFKFEEPVLTSDVISGESIQLFGQTILTTPQLNDEDGIIANGLMVERQVEVRGFADSDGQLYATRVRDRGTPDPLMVSVDGLVTEINQPNIVVFGITIDTTISTFLDSQGLPISQTTFFNLLTLESEVEVNDAILDEMTGIVSGGILQIDELDDLNRSPDNKAGTPLGLGVGTITGSFDVMFRDSFE